MTLETPSVEVTAPDALERTLTVLRSGGIVVAPTETAYGILADATQPNAVEAVRAAKRRDPGVPFPVFLADHTQLAEYAVPFERVRAIADATLPGPLTLRVLAQPGLELAPNIVDEEGEISIRISSHPFIREVSREMGVPLIATSANRSGGSTTYALEDLQPEVRADVDLLVDGGALKKDRISTVVRIAGEKDSDIELIREGVVPLSVVMRA